MLLLVQSSEIVQYFRDIQRFFAEHKHFDAHRFFVRLLRLLQPFQPVLDNRQVGKHLRNKLRIVPLLFLEDFQRLCVRHKRVVQAVLLLMQRAETKQYIADRLGAAPKLELRDAQRMFELCLSVFVQVQLLAQTRDVVVYSRDVDGVLAFIVSDNHLAHD